MILLTVLIILFIILLLYKCRLFTEEKYTIGSLGIDWKNKAGVSGSVNKWIMVLYDDETGNKIHETEDDSPQNLQNFMDVNLKAIEDKKFGSEILGTNTLSVYYNSISDDTKVYSGEFSLGTNDFSASVSDISAKESNVPTWYELTSGPKKDTLEEILGTEGTKIYVYPKDSTEDLYKFINRNACDINDPKWWVRKTCFILELGFEKTGDIGYFYPYFPGLVETDHKYFGVNSTNKIVMVNETSRKKFYLEKPEGVTDTNTVKYGKFAYETTGGDKYYMYVSGDDKLKVAKLSDINNKSSTIFEFRYSKDCESYWENVNKEKVDGNWKFGSEVYDCGPGDIHDCQRWRHVRIDKVGEGESCPSDMKVNGYVIKTQWPKETTISEMNTNYPTYLETTYANIIAENTDPNKNKTLVNTPQFYKNEYDTINASINANKEQQKEIINGIRYVWFGYEKSSWSDRPLNIREIEVYSGNVNIVEGFGGDKVESETGFYRDGASFPPQQLFDQNTSAAYNFGHTQNGETNYFKIDLGKEYSVIDKVMVYNRTDCCQDRWASSFVKLLDDNGNEIVRSKETLPDNKTEAKNYKEYKEGNNVRVKTFTFPEAAALAPTPIKVVFHYGSFNSDYGDANVNAAADAGHVYDNTPTGTTYGFGKITSRSTVSNQTTYTWTPPGTVTADVLIVAGGGGGGGVVSGGGGAGGLVFAPGESFSGEQTVVVGNGGEGGDGFNTSTQNGTPGSDSTCLTYTAKGGGGGTHYGGNTTKTISEGGSGGGGALASHASGGGSSNQDDYDGKGFGNDGGRMGDKWPRPGGGGGASGTGGDGSSGSSSTSGIGGIGKDYSSTFTTTYGDNGWFASGGGGGTYDSWRYDIGIASEGGGTDGAKDKADDAQPHTAVSYTHLTLPTILLV